MRQGELLICVVVVGDVLNTFAEVEPSRDLLAHCRHVDVSRTLLAKIRSNLVGALLTAVILRSGRLGK